jgi:hypothetical protein
MIVNPRTSTRTIRKMGTSGDANREAGAASVVWIGELKYDFIGDADVIRSTART